MGMMTTPRSLMLLVIIVLGTACGGNDPTAADYRGSFTGNWTGTLTITVTGAPSQTQPLTVTVTNGTDRTHVEFAGTCAFVGTVDSDTHVTLPAKDCPSTTSGGCTLGFRVSSGSFTRSGSTAALLYTGTVTSTGAASCYPGTYTFSAAANPLNRS
jgi:hypothetical protein